MRQLEDPRGGAVRWAGEVPELEPPEEGFDRYLRDPQLAILESYALDVVGELSAEEVAEVADAVAGCYGDLADWRAVVRRRFGWAPLVDGLISVSWQRYAARDPGVDPDPAAWARGFADEAARRARS